MSGENENKVFLPETAMAPESMRLPNAIDWDHASKLNPVAERAYFDKKFAEMSGIKFTVPCQKHGPQPMVFACKHAGRTPLQDHPGLIRTVQNYIVCKTCWKLINQHRFKYGTEIICECWLCVREIIPGLRQKNPELVVDLIHDKK